MPSALVIFSRCVLAVAHDVREVSLHWPLALLQFRQRALLRLEPGDRAQPVVKHPLVGRITVDEVGADVENAGRPRTTHQIAKEQRAMSSAHDRTGRAGRRDLRHTVRFRRPKHGGPLP